MALPFSVRAADVALPPIDGVVTAVSAASLSLTASKTKKIETFLVTEQTKVVRDREPVSIAEIQNGEVAVVIGHRDGAQQVADTIYVKRAR